uniref:Invertebrate defensins family profile domain-containing protein n=1 Tax=Stomoxys calcitrans TaxID=35570 RepID=A0A2Y9D4Q7_STOCA
MKFLNVVAIALLVVACLAVYSNAAPHEGVKEVAAAKPMGITCDLLSLWKVGHAACAAHCLVLGNVGGYCTKEGLCVCKE